MTLQILKLALYKEIIKEGGYGFIQFINWEDHEKQNL